MFINKHDKSARSDKTNLFQFEINFDSNFQSLFSEKHDLNFKKT